uniref:hypothetical protein n=1 Tax=Clostridium sp. NkU-1 TaxID=1095009 RepID=UPI0006D081F0
MYAMPETGARVWLYFPNEKEDSGIVVESIGEEQEYPEAFDKIFETKEKKKVRIETGSNDSKK